MYDTTVLRPFGARDSSAITQRDPHPEEPATGVAGTGEPGTEAADRADDLLAEESHAPNEIENDEITIRRQVHKV